MLKMVENKGITLIALIVTIVVLLILAGVTVSQITGSENAMEKATEAREKNEQGAELDAINLAVVNSVASDLTGLVNTTALKQGLTGLVKGNLDTIIDPTKTEWEVEGNTGRLYKITNTGNVEIASTVNITKDGEIVAQLSYNINEIELNTTTIQLNATATADLTINSVIWESSNTNMATIDNTGLVTLLTTGSTTITLKANTTGGNFTKTCTIKITEPLEIGDTVSYSTSLNEITLSNWKVFYIDENYTYIILDDFLPNSALSSTIRTNYNLTNGTGDYNIKSTTNRADLINAMTSTSNWSSLLTGTLNGTEINYGSSTDTNIKAMGSPTLELYVNSWNVKYSSNQIYTATKTDMADTIGWGYYVGGSANPTTDRVNKSNTDALYYPHTSTYESCNGYWLASPSAKSISHVMLVNSYGIVLGYNYNDRQEGNSYYIPAFAFRPVVCLPSSIF